MLPEDAPVWLTNAQLEELDYRKLYLGAIHTCEIPYLFDTRLPDPMGSGDIVGTDECEFLHVSKEMWANFAQTGKPSTDKYEWNKLSG